MHHPALPICTPVVPRAERISRLNDILRLTGLGGHILITRAVSNLDGFDSAELLGALAKYDDFDALNDPHGEHDCGAFDFCGAELLWKIDYYDARMEYGSDDPADPAVTQRVLTVTLAEEY